MARGTPAHYGTRLIRLSLEELETIDCELENAIVDLTGATQAAAVRRCDNARALREKLAKVLEAMRVANAAKLKAAG